MPVQLAVTSLKLLPILYYSSREALPRAFSFFAVHAYLVGMSTEVDKLYYTTTTVVGWIDVFTRSKYIEILYDSIRYCQEHKGLEVFGYVIMPNHFHLICRSTQWPLNHVLRDLKSFTSKKMIEAIASNPQESRREWLMYMFEYFGKRNSQNTKFQFWQHGNHPIELWSIDVIRQKLNYLHQNPVKAEFVTDPHHYLHSSAHEDRRLNTLELNV